MKKNIFTGKTSNQAHTIPLTLNMNCHLSKWNRLVVYIYGYAHLKTFTTDIEAFFQYFVHNLDFFSRLKN